MDTCRRENLLSIAADSGEVFVTVQDIVLLLIRCMTTIDSKTLVTLMCIVCSRLMIISFRTTQTDELKILNVIAEILKVSLSLSLSIYLSHIP